MIHNYVVSGFFISLLPLALSNTHPFPENKEYVYTYHATVTVGSKEPGFYVTKYEIFADIHVKSKKRVMVQLKDVAYSFYNGPSLTGISKKITAPQEAEAITFPFGLVLDEPVNGFLTAHYLDERDEVWSRTLKEYIANLLYIDTKIILDENFARDPKTFSEAIDVKYDKDKYTYISSEAGHIAFIRRLPGYYKDKWYKYTASVPKFDDCGKHDRPVDSDIRRYYDIIKEGNELKLNEIYSNNTIRFGFNMDEYFAKIDQEIKFKSSRDLTTNIPMFSRYHQMLSKFDYGSMVIHSRDLSNGRRRQNMTSIKSSVENIFLSVCDRVNNIEISKSNIDLDANDNLIVLIDEMKLLNSESLYMLYFELLKNDQILDKKQMEIYVLALAFAGTGQSLHTIQKLISEKIIHDDLAAKTLREITLNLKVFDSLFVDDMMHLYENEPNYSSTVREAIILSFSALLKDHNSKVQEKMFHQNIHKVFFKQITEKLQNATEHDKQLLYLTTLLNMKNDLSFFYVIEIVLKRVPNVQFSPHIRSLALIGLVGSLEWIQKSLAGRQEAVSVFALPIFNNTDEDYEVRATALYVLLNYGRESDYEILLEHMKTEKDEQFLNMFHSAVQSSIKSTSECYRSRVEGIKNEYSKMPKPKISKRTSFLITVLDYYDEVNKFGSMLKISTYGDENINGFNTAFIEYNWKFKDSFYDPYMIYVHVRRDPSVPDHIRGIPEILSLTEKEMPIEMIVYRNSVAVKIINTSPKGLLKYLLELENGFEFPLTYNLDQPYSNFVIINSEMGVPVMFYQKKSSLTMKKAISVSEESSSSTNVQFSRWSREEHGLKVYNPIANMWHVVQRVQSVDVNLYADIEERNSNKFIWKLIDAKSSPLGIKSEVQTEVYVSGEVSMKTVVQNEEHIRENHTFWSFDDENTGLVFNFGIYDCEPHQKEKHVHQIKQRFLMSDRINLEDNFCVNVYLMVQQVIDYFSVFPGTGKCGLTLSIGKSESLNLTHYEALVQESDFKQTPAGDLVLKPGVQIDFKGMRGGEVVKKFAVELQKNYKKGTKYSYRLWFEIFKSKVNFESSKSVFGLNIEGNSSTDYMHSNILITSGEKVKEELTVNSLVNITIAGKLSEEQNNNQIREIELYKECLDNSIVESNACLGKLTSLRSYEFDISFQEPTTTFNNMRTYFYDLLKGIYPEAFDKISTSEKMDDGRIKLSLTYPLVSEGIVDLLLNEKIEIKTVALENSTIGKLFEPYSAFSFGVFDTLSYCEFTINKIWNSRSHLERNFSLHTKWTRMTGSCQNDTCIWEVKARKVSNSKNDNLMVIRIEFNREIVDIHVDEKVEIFVNSELMDVSENSRYYHTEFIDIKVFNDDVHVIVNIESVPLVIDFKRNNAKIEMALKSGDGLCHT